MVGEIKMVEGPFPEAAQLKQSPIQILIQRLDEGVACMCALEERYEAMRNQLFGTQPEPVQKGVDTPLRKTLFGPGDGELQRLEEMVERILLQMDRVERTAEFFCKAFQ